MTIKYSKSTAMAALLISATFSFMDISPSYAVGSEESRSHYLQAKEFMDAADYRSAVIELRNSLKADPNNVDARLMLARAYIEFGQGIAAQTEIEAARERGADRTITAVSMAKAYVLQRKYKEAVIELDAVEIPAADQMDAHLIYGDVQFLDGDADAAKSSFVAAETAAPAHYKPKMALARLAMQQREIAEARIKIDEALALAPTNTDVYLTSGLIRRAEGDQEAAMADLSSAVEFSSNNLSARLERAATSLELGRPEDAQADLDAVLELVPKHPMALYLSAVIQARSGDFESANALLDETGSALDGFLPGELLQGIVSLQVGNLEKASLLLGRVVSSQPGNIIARRGYGAALLRQGNARGAIGALEPLIELGDQDPRVFALLGTAYMRAGDVENAQIYLEKAVTAVPDAKGLRTQLAIGKLALGDKDSAIDELEGVLDEDPDQLRAAMMLALIERRDGNYDKALKWADQVVETIPDSALGYNTRGAIHISRADYAAARKDFEHALQVSKNFHLARSNLAQLERLEGNHDEARRQLQYILNEDRNNTRALIALTELSMLMGNYSEAVEWADRAVNVAPKVSAYHLLLVQTHISNSDNDAAYRAILDADQAFPSDPKVASVLGQIEFALGKFSEAAASYARWVRMEPENRTARMQMARAEWRAGRIEDARATYARALGMSEGKVDDTYRNILADLVTLESEAGNFDQALGYVMELKKLFPETGVPDLMLGSLYYQSDRIDESIRAFKDALDKDDSLRTRTALARAYLKGGQGDAAVQTLEGWIAGNPDSMPAIESLGLTLIQLKRWDAAAKQIEAVIASSDEASPILLNNLAYVYYETGDDRAADIAQKAHDLAPDNPAIADTLGWILVDTDSDVRRGLLLLQEAVRGSEGDPQKLYHLGVAFAKSGRVPEARQSLRQALDLIGTFDEEAEAQELLQQLSSQ